MTLFIQDRTQLRVLLVEQEDDLAQDIADAFVRIGMQIVRCHGHLRAISLLDDEPFDCLFISAQGTDVSGPELCSLIRAREGRKAGVPLYLVLYGRESELVFIASAGRNADDYLISPWLDVELEWKMDRAAKDIAITRQALALRLEDPGTGLLTAEGLRAFLYEEVNRVGRRQGWFSLSVLHIQGLDALRISYGADWMNWFASGIWAYLRRQLRNYDRLATMDGGFLALISPDLDEVGTRTLLGRLHTAIDEYQLQESGQGAQIGLAARYLCVRVLGDYNQFGRTGDVLWSWLEEQMSEQPSSGILGHTGTVAMELVCDLSADT